MPYLFHFIGTYVGNHRKALQLLGLNADGSPFEPAPTLPALPSSALPGMIPADHFARDWLRMDYSTTNPTCPMPGFAPPVPPVPPGVASGLPGLTGKVQQAGKEGVGTGTQDKEVGKYLTGRAGEGSEVQVAESAYLTLCKLVRGGQLRPSRPGLKKALQKMRIGQNQVERQAIADGVLRRMEEGRVVCRNPSYTGASCGLSEFLPVLDSHQEPVALPDRTMGNRSAQRG